MNRLRIAAVAVVLLLGGIVLGGMASEDTASGNTASGDMALARTGWGDTASGNTGPGDMASGETGSGVMGPRVASPGWPALPGAAGAGVLAIVQTTQEEIGFYQELSWSPDGSSLLLSVLEADEALENFTYQIYRIGVDGSGLTRLTDGPRDYWTSWSPDGSHFTFAALREGNFDIYTRAADGTDERRLTRDPAQDQTPFWSPDGARIVFVSERGGQRGIWVMAADGSGAERIAEPAGAAYNPVWSPDGERIAFYATDADGTDHVYVMNADGTDLRSLAEGVWPSWSPDGADILYARKDRLYLIDPDGSGSSGSERVVGEGAFIGEYSPDGSRIAYITRVGNTVSVVIAAADGSDPTTILERPAPEW